MACFLSVSRRGPVLCAEGYLFELERRGYLQAGAFVPEVVLDYPEGGFPAASRFFEGRQ